MNLRCIFCLVENYVNFILPNVLPDEVAELHAIIQNARKKQ